MAEVVDFLLGKHEATFKPQYHQSFIEKILCLKYNYVLLLHTRIQVNAYLV
jgi:hypothetical protein